VVLSSVALGLLILALLVAAGLGVLGGRFDSEVGTIAGTPGAEAAVPAGPPFAAPAPTAQNVLLIGSAGGAYANGVDGPDVQASAAQPASMMLVHIAADRASMLVVSVLPASVLDGAEPGTLSEVLAAGGVPRAVRTVETLTGVAVDQVAVVDLAGFAGATSALNQAGVPVGSDAVTNAQAGQEAVRAVLVSLTAGSTFGNLRTVLTLNRTLTPYVAVTESLTAGYLVTLGWQLRGLEPEAVTYLTVPGLDLAGVIPAA
jgi:anionic cell wall polymer biosynthesis LytR-Cps2A-Psr (LCP) family protein